MSNSFLGLRTCIYKVNDMDKAKTWYSKAFGVEPYFDEPFYIGFNVAGFELGLQPGEETYEQKVDTVITYWGVEDIRQKFSELIALGAKEHEPPTNVGGELMVATVLDPWGNILGVIYNPEFAG
ncbi:MAG: VOC family protein [Saprospiraceae bacterium]